MRRKKKLGWREKKRRKKQDRKGEQDKYISNHNEGVERKSNYPKGEGKIIKTKQKINKRE